MAQQVRITDVSPRDGLQNESGVIPTADKIRLIELLDQTGVDEIEITSFVSRKWVPQLGDAAEVIRGLAASPPLPAGVGPMHSSLAPNLVGLQAALNANRDAGRKIIDKISVFTAASETFNKKNTNATIAESIERFVPMISAAHSAGLFVRGYISCVIACPFEGAIEPEKVAAVAERLKAIGVDELDLGDTIGAGTPESTRGVLRAVAAVWPIAPRSLPPSAEREMLTLHLHDTFGRAADCVRAALDEGITSFDGSVAGLGGCPYASTLTRRAPGNIDTALLVRTIHDAGFTTNVDLDALARAAEFAREIVTRSRLPSQREGQGEVPLS